MIISKTPLRASFFGGGCDFADYYQNSKYGYGCVISVTLDMHVYITVNKRFDDKIRVVYTGNELVNSVDEVRHNIIREALRLTGIESGIEIVYTADLPMTDLGVGLGSSSALAVGVLNALHTYKGEYATARQLAQEAIEIEINRLGQQIGIQDQYAVACGGFNKYIFNADNSVEVLPIVLRSDIRNKLLEKLMLFYTGNPRDSRKIFVEQKKNIVEHREMLDVLVDAVKEALDALQAGNVDLWGELLNKTWQIKKTFASTISNQLIDEMYDLAIRNGAAGGKILGAGGGGFMLLYVPIEYQEDLKRALYQFRQIPFSIDMQGSRIIFAD